MKLQLLIGTASTLAISLIFASVDNDKVSLQAQVADLEEYQRQTRDNPNATFGTPTQRFNRTQRNIQEVCGGNNSPASCNRINQQEVERIENSEAYREFEDKLQERLDRDSSR